MQVRKKTSASGTTKSLVLGIVIGLLIGSAGLVYSAMGKAGWDKQPAYFKLGYIAGFNDVIRMVKRSVPDSAIAKDYTLPRNAKIPNWLYTIETMYKDPKYKDRNISQMMALAGSDMKAQYGEDIVVVSGLEQLAKALARRREALLSGEIEPTPPDVLAKRRLAIAKEEVRRKCMSGCRRTCRDTCKAEVKERFPPKENAEPAEAVEPVPAAEKE